MNKLEKFTSVIVEYTAFINKVLTRTEQINEPHKFIHTVSFKTNNSLYTANFLLSNFLKEPYFTDSIFLILRTIMSDVITYYYILCKSDNDNIYVENINNLYFQHIKYALSSLKIFKEGYHDGESKIEAMKDEIKINNKNYFDEEGNSLFVDEIKGINGMVKEIANNKYLNPFAIKAYGLYEIFSKYEHLGELTYELIHRQFSIEIREQILGEIHEAIEVIINFQKSSMACFLIDNSEIETFMKLSDKIEAIKIYE